MPTPKTPRAPRAGACALGILTALLAPAVHAQSFTQPGFNLQTFRPALDSYGLITLNGTTVLEHLDFAVELQGSWAWQPLTLQAGSGAAAQQFSAAHLVTPQFQVALALWRRLEVGLSLPVPLLFGTLSDGSSFSKGSVGDPGIHFKLGLLNNARYAVGLALLASVYLPLPHWAGVPSSQYLISEPSVTVRPQIALDREWLKSHRLRTVINIGALIRPSTSTFTDSGTGLSRSAGTQLSYGLGLQYTVARDRFDLLGEISGYADLAGNASNAPLEGMAGIKAHISANAYFLGGVGGGLISGQTGSPTLRVYAGFHFEPRGRDRDHDGIPDAIDQCPDLPEDKDGFEDEDGCPDLDNDGDGIPDIMDKCPDDPETFNGYQDEDGCPDEVPEVKANRGKVGDRDGDGIPDDIDMCPDEPEDMDGFQDEDGCPDLDNDGDGIPDKEDRCPNEPETVNGFEDDDGCPDKPPKALVNVTNDGIQVLERIFFVATTAEIKAESHHVLDAVASVLRHTPQIKLVEIQGHADERGDEKTNLRLTQERATAILQYLVNKRVRASRLRAKGYGSSKPLCQDWNEECWAKNRRVEFVILKRGDSSPTSD